MKKRKSQKTYIISGLALVLIVGIILAMAMEKLSGDSHNLKDVETKGEIKSDPIDQNEKVQFEDAALELAIRELIHKPDGAITAGDVNYLRVFKARDQGISSLTGLEYLQNLVVLDLRGNLISDITPLQSLDSLREVNLRGNMIRDLSPLQQLTELVKLNARSNYIQDISPLSGLPLQNLNLRRNQIRDVEPLAQITTLKERLFLQGNSIQDVTPLKSFYSQIEKTDFYAERFSGIPEIHIDTFGKSVESKTERIEATMMMQNSVASNYPEEGMYEGKIGIRGRGNSSWEAPKKPFNIELWNDERQGTDHQILDLSEEEDWILIPNYYDKSLMRNFIVFDVASKFGMMYTPDSRFVDVYINGDYEGLYLLTGRIKRDKYRVGVKKLTDVEKDQSEPRVSGGYILKLDRLQEEGKLEEEPYFTTSIGKVNVLFHDPSTEEMTEAQESYIATYLEQFESALYGDQFKDPALGYRKYIDVDSFIDWFLIKEMTKDVDAWRKSTYMYKDRNDKLYMGPVWDFDIGFGNANYDDAWKTDGWSPILSIPNSWYVRLFEDEQFVREVIERWNTNKPIVENIPYTIDETASLLESSAQRNFERWPILGKYVWPNVAPYPETYQGEVDRLREWIAERVHWMDQNIEGLMPK